jgi:hypothetical protein
VTTVEQRDERLANNEVIFRTVNESIDQQAARFGGLDTYEFICECATSECFDRIALTREQYESVRQHGKRFFVAPGHQDLQVELVVESHGTFVVVEKDGSAGIVADAADPRAAEH